MTEQARVFGKRILVVEDDASARESLNLLLRIDRHKVVGTASGREALDRFAKESFDLVILDYAMPEMQGNELALKIKLMAPGQPILMVTAYFEKLVDFSLPVDALLAKPFGIDELRQAIGKLSERLN
jgi:CheY-like chemotaxis protein